MEVEMPESVFSTLLIDLSVIAIFGALGGFGLGLLQDKGLELPRVDKEDNVRFADLGFIAAIGVGALAGLISYAVNPPSDVPKLVGLGLTAGVGGVGILKGYTKGTDLEEHKAEAAKEVASALRQDPNQVSDEDFRKAIARVS
jgi:ribose/xylose/arabinose/galactoside ABC-type transport system permease subunit